VNGGRCVLSIKREICKKGRLIDYYVWEGRYMNVTTLMIILLVPLAVVGLLAIGGLLVWRMMKKKEDNNVDNDIGGNVWDRPVEKRLWNDRPVSTELKEDLAEVVRIMKEREEAKAMRERDEELIVYAKRKRKEMPMGSGMTVSGLGEDRPVRVKNSNIAIPFNLSEIDKQILEEFYGDN
jgi:hypothetical protein